MNFRKDRPSFEQDEISRLRKRVAFLEHELQRLKQKEERGNRGQEGPGNYLGQAHFLVDDEEHGEGIVPENPVEELPNLEDEEFTFDNMLLYGGEDEKKMENETWEDILNQEEETEKKETSESTNEGCCMFCSRTIISEGDESEHYKHCPEYNRWTDSENNSFYSPHYYASSYSSNYSPSTTGYISSRNDFC